MVLPACDSHGLGAFQGPENNDVRAGKRTGHAQHLGRRARLRSGSLAHSLGPTLVLSASLSGCNPKGEASMISPVPLVLSFQDYLSVSVRL